MKIPDSVIRVQVDRWPIIPKPKRGVWPHFLSIIIAGSFTDQPTKEEMKATLHDAIQQIEEA